MILQLKQIFEITGQSLDFSEIIDIPKIEKALLYENFAAPVEICGTVKNRAGVVTLEYSLKAVLNQNCDRCLEAFEREYNFDFSHTLMLELANHGDADDDLYDDYILCPDNTLDMSKLAISDLLLSLPTKILCRNDCAGLCMSCGKNLNYGVCDCNDN